MKGRKSTLEKENATRKILIRLDLSERDFSSRRLGSPHADLECGPRTDSRGSCVSLVEVKLSLYMKEPNQMLLFMFMSSLVIFSG